MGGLIPLAKYLFTRLHQCGIRSVHGVPGDFTLKALDHLKASKLQWIGNCNELNAGYAADGYARMRGASALFTTYGVGELSAINAVAGSYAEYVPVIHIVGTPQRHLQNSGAIVHHTLGDGRSRIFAEIYEKVTVAQANLITVETSPQMIDHTLERCLMESRPVYIELPCDMVSQQVSSDRLRKPLEDQMSFNGEEEDQQLESLLRKIYSAKQPLLLVDRGAGVPYMKQEINDFVKLSVIPTLTMPSGGGMIDHSIKNYFGVHSGPVGQIDTMPFVESCDLVIAFGPMFSDTQTMGFKVVPSSAKTVTMGKNYIDDAANSRVNINGKRFMQKLLKNLNIEKISGRHPTSLADFRKIKAPLVKPDAPIDQSTFYLRLNEYFRAGDVILLGNATPILGGRDFHLPPQAQIIASGMWFSIGHMLPAAQGVSLAQLQTGDGKGRTILLDGDGSFQVTAQELSTIMRERLNITIFIINNGGYAYERLIHGMDEDYNDIAPWRYLDAPRFFGAPPRYKVQTTHIKTWRQMDDLLASESFNDGIGLKLVEVEVGKYDVPEKFKAMFKVAGEQI